jgi:hypothetical protein
MRNKPFKGEVRIFENSSLRKLMRAARRGKIPPERLGIIKRAVAKAALRKAVHPWGATVFA